MLRLWAVSDWDVIIIGSSFVQLRLRQLDLFLLFIIVLIPCRWAYACDRSSIDLRLPLSVLTLIRGWKMTASQEDVFYCGWDLPLLLLIGIIDYRWIMLIHSGCVYSYDAFFQEKYKKKFNRLILNNEEMSNMTNMT